MIFLNGHEIKPTIFPDKTSQVWNVDPEFSNSKINEIMWKFEHEGEFMHVVQLRDLLRSKGFKCGLHMPYLPYARQDKAVTNTETFALRSFANLINKLTFQYVSAIDPHSMVAKHFIYNFVELSVATEINFAAKETDATLFCYPDDGALKKYTKYLDDPHAYGEKHRDQQTGKITDYKLFGDVKGQSVLIVDDICDGGMTFILLADALIVAGARDINLYVSHGIFSKGTEVLHAAGIKRIFTKEGEVK